MSPKRTLTAEQRPAKGNSTPFRSPTRSSTKTTLVRAEPSLDTPTVKLKPVQQPSTAPENLTKSPQSARRKRRREPEDECSDKRQRKDPQPVVERAPCFTPLTRENLEKLHKERIPESSDSKAANKRSRSRQSSNTETNQDTASASSQKSSFSLSDYRLICLDRARIVVGHKGLPKHIQNRVDSIIEPETCAEKKSVLFSITDSLCESFPNVLEVASREDGSVELIYHALESMGKQLFSGVFAFRRKADWDRNLIPNVQQETYHSDPPDRSINDMNNSLDRPSRRQEAEMSYISPEISETTMPPSSLPPKTTMPPPPFPTKQDASGVKTPRPDITIGFHHSVIAEKLMMLGVGGLNAHEILKNLQYSHDLYSSPTQQTLRIHFPTIVVEGKSYATGKSVYEAENQAAVSGSCMLAVQHQLDHLAERRSPGSHQSREHLAFSICSEGPMMLLYVHYTTSLQSARFHNMHFLKSCHATGPESVREFFMAVAGIMRWASSELLENVAKQLFLVWKAAQS